MYYLPLAAQWANAYITGPNDAADTLNLYDVSGVAHYELANAIVEAGNPPGLATTPAALIADLKKQLDKAVAQSDTDPFGFGFPWGTWDTTSHGAGLSVMASEYDHLTGTTTYAAYADEWLGNILGANGWGLSFIVGDGTKFPDCLQHQVANLAGSLNGTGTILAGAAVEGPNSKATTGSVSGMIACPRQRRGHLRGLQLLQRRIPGQHAVLLQHRTGDRPDRRLAAGVRLADERSSNWPPASQEVAARSASHSSRPAAGVSPDMHRARPAGIAVPGWPRPARLARGARQFLCSRQLARRWPAARRLRAPRRHLAPDPGVDHRVTLP